MEFTTLKDVAPTDSLLDDLVSDNELWREVMAAIRTAEIDSAKKVPRSPGGMKGMHQRAEELENVANALQARGVLYHVVKNQPRLRLPKPDRPGSVEIVLSSGVPQAGGFAVYKKGLACRDLISLQSSFLIDWDGGDDPVTDEGLFLVLEKQWLETGDPDVKIKKVVAHLAYPARLNPAGTFISCDSSRIVGCYELRPGTARPEVTTVLEQAKPVTPIVSRVAPVS